MLHIVMETQTIANLLGNADNESLKSATRKCYVINDQNNTDYGDGDENVTTIEFETKVIQSNLCDYSDAYTHINDEHVDNAYNLDIVMSTYNLIEYSDNYSDTSARLWQFKRDDVDLLMLLQMLHHLLNINQVSLENQLLMVVIEYLKT